MSVHILVICEYWRAGKSELGRSLTETYLFGVLECVPTITYEAVHYDAQQWIAEGQSLGRAVTDRTLVQACLEHPPDLIYFNRTPHDGPNPSNITLAYLRETLTIPIIAMWPDVDADDIRMIDQHYPMIDVNISTDHCPIAPYTRRPEHYLHIWVPWDTRIVRDPGLERDIPVSFIGSVSNDGGRQEAIDLLRAVGVPVWVGGGRGEQDVSRDQYYEILQRSKITLNFSSSQLKGRTTEALHCGALLMEPSHTPLHQYFDPGLEYVPYTETHDLVLKVQYYLKHDVERARIAARGHDRAIREYSAIAWWSRVLAEARARVPAFRGEV